MLEIIQLKEEVGLDRPKYKYVIKKEEEGGGTYLKGHKSLMDAFELFKIEEFKLTPIVLQQYLCVPGKPASLV